MKKNNYITKKLVMFKSLDKSINKKRKQFKSKNLNCINNCPKTNKIRYILNKRRIN